MLTEREREIAIRTMKELGESKKDWYIDEFADRFLQAIRAAQEPDGWIDGEGDPYSVYGWGEKPPKGWTSEAPYPVFRTPPAPAVPTCKCDLRTKLVGDGCEVCNPEYAKDHYDEPEPAVPALLDAAKAVVDRWDTPLWKDVPATAQYINALRAEIAAAPKRGEKE